MKKIYCVRWRQNGRIRQQEFTSKKCGSELNALLAARIRADVLKRNQVEYELFSAWEENFLLTILKTEVRWLKMRTQLWKLLCFMVGIVVAIYASKLL